MAAAIRMSQITGPPLAKSVGMGLLKAFAREVQSAKCVEGEAWPASPALPEGRCVMLSPDIS
jgi:hypothetical protein